MERLPGMMYSSFIGKVKAERSKSYPHRIRNRGILRKTIPLYSDENYIYLTTVDGSTSITLQKAENGIKEPGAEQGNHYSCRRTRKDKRQSANTVLRSTDSEKRAGIRRTRREKNILSWPKVRMSVREGRILCRHVYGGRLRR
ncbi:MAG: hypothetical protein ACLRSW_11460 [Christensenellaceae bacterium]